MNKEKTKKRIERLIKKYESLTSVQLKRYNESMTCKDFILPLFQALGWDINNKFFDEEVISEKQVSGKKADYAFHIDGVTKFFIEAKKPKENIKEEKHAKQAIMYAWHKSVPWAILTNFKSIRVFNAEWDELDPERSLIFEISYQDYLTDKKLWFLSKKSFENGKLDKYAEENYKRPKKEPITKQLAEDLIKWRDNLYRQLRAWNDEKKFSDFQITESVQKILNRLIFIRTIEDRGIEDQKLREIIRNWKEEKERKDFFSQELKKLFKYYWDEYDSKLFDEHTCDFIEYLDEFIANIIDELYKNQKGIRYNFDFIPADVLGTIYEQYLGKIQQEEINKKPSKKRSQGIYYTPRYIVDYIIKNTLSEVLKEKSLEEIKNIKILDPACGSGSFLIKVLEELVNYWQMRTDKNVKYEKGTHLGNLEKSFKMRRGQKELSSSFKIGLLRNNIYGIDLDEKAVEIAQLNLLLKIIQQRQLLPDLSHSLACGNSLISGTEKKLKKYFGKDWKKKKSFNWEEKFPEVFNRGGFDIIIGNPPYIKEYVDKSIFNGLHDSLYYQGKMDIWTLFACIAIDLLKDGGYFSFIAPNNWLTNTGASIFRDKILQEGEIVSFINFGDYKVFQNVGIQTMIFVFKKCKPRKSYKVRYSKIEDKNIKEEELINFLKSSKQITSSKIVNFEITINPQKLIGNNITFVSSQKDNILQKIENCKNFELTDKEVGQGIVAAPDKYFLVKNLNDFIDKEKSYIKRYYTSSEKFNGGLSKNYIFYISDKNFKEKSLKNYPNIRKHFELFKIKLKKAKIKYGTPNKPYFYLHRERDEKFFQKGPKIICGVRVLKPSFYFTEEEYYGSRALNFIKTNRIDLKYLTGILNSNLVYFWLKNKGKQLGDLLQIDKGPLLNIPIYLTNNKSKQKEIIRLVEKITKLNKELRKLHNIMDEKEYKEIESKIQKIDKIIDQKVYELYRLTKEGIEIVKKFNKK